MFSPSLFLFSFVWSWPPLLCSLSLRCGTPDDPAVAPAEAGRCAGGGGGGVGGKGRRAKGTKPSLQEYISKSMRAEGGGGDRGITLESTARGERNEGVCVCFLLLLLRINYQPGLNFSKKKKERGAGGFWPRRVVVKCDSPPLVVTAGRHGWTSRRSPWNVLKLRPV